MNFQSTRPVNDESQNRTISFLSAAVLLSPCLSYAIIGDAPLIPVIACIALLFSILRRRPIAITVRSVVYSFTVTFIVTVILSLTYPVDSDRFFSPLPTEILFPFAISIGICATFFSQSQGMLITILTLSIVAMMLQGSCVNDPTNTRLIITSELWRNRFWVFGFFLFFQMCAFIPLLYFAQEKRDEVVPPNKRQPRRAFLYACSLVFFACVIGISCNLAAKVERMMEPVFNSLFTMYISSFRSKIVFGPEVNLYRKVDSAVQKNKDRVVLRAHSRKPPGYLRGRVYTNYANGEWESDTTKLTRLPVMSDGIPSTISRFYRGIEEPDVHDATYTSVDIIPSRFFYSDVLLAGGNTQVVELIAEALETNEDGILFPKSWDRDGAYTTFSSEVYRQSTYMEPKPENEGLQRYLEISDNQLQIELNRIGKTFLSNPPTSKLEQIREIEDYFLKNYTYDLGTAMEGKVDPVLEFLTDKKSGHCELFATATALLLRSQGIPARYVTGFVCAEPHPKENYWIARLGDCHAWVEAWLPDKSVWILVEPTPPTGIPQGTSRLGEISVFRESMIVLWKEAFAQIKRGYFAEAVMTMVLGIASFFGWLLWTGPWYVGWALGVLAVLLVLRVVLKKFRRLRVHEETNLSEIHLIYLEIESHLKTFGISRNSNMSIRDLSKSIIEVNRPIALDAKSILDEYEVLRYSPRCPDVDRVTRLKDRVSAWKYFNSA